jgi:hypothetical protein
MDRSLIYYLWLIRCDSQPEVKRRDQNRTLGQPVLGDTITFFFFSSVICIPHVNYYMS